MAPVDDGSAPVHDPMAEDEEALTFCQHLTCHLETVPALAPLLASLKAVSSPSLLIHGFHLNPLVGFISP